jgi:DNA-binding CsgD family transcriptional regulator
MNRGELYEAIHDETAFAEIPTTIARLSAGRSSTIYRFDNAGLLTDLQYCHFPRDMVEGILADPKRSLDTWGNVGFASGVVGRTIALDDLLPEAEFRRSLFWNELMRPLGDDTGHCMGIVHQFNGATLCTAIQRPFGTGAFSPAETARLDSLIVDLQRVYLTRNILGEKDNRIGDLADLLESGDEGLLLVGPRLRVIEATARAKAALDGRGASFRDTTLRFADPHLETRIRQAVEDTLHRRPTAQVTFSCENPADGSVVRLLVLPIASDGRSGCIIRVRAEDAAASHARLWLVRHFGLTDAEARVAEALAAGHAPDEISAQRAVSLNTVRSQVRQVLQKTGCETVTKLVVLIRRLP